MLLTDIKAKDMKDQVALADLLASLGYQPEKISGNELIYLSMLRDNDTKPSFAVNRALNVWYDHGMGKGGNVIDFAMAYWNLTFIEALKKMSAFCGAEISNQPPSLRTRRKHAQKLPYYRVEEVKPLGGNRIISDYLKERGVWEAAQNHLSEIYYYVENENKIRKHFFAAGWLNELGSWEVRNPYFKGSLGHKAITFIGRDAEALSIFEGCFDYLSWRADNPFAADSILILNSASLLESAIRKAKDFLEISLFLDRDDIGRQASADFIRAIPAAIDKSTAYLDFKDYNEMLVSRMKKRHTIHRGG